MSIEVKNLTKIYGEQKAIDNVTFTVNKGEIVGFLGPNGAGKSTTMKIITGYLQPDGGEAIVSGIAVKEQPLQAKATIGYLPEANPLYYDQYVREYLDFIADVHGVPAKSKKERIESVIQTVGLSLESNKKIGQLSKGYKQRVGLAAALIHDPEVLILDEPTTGLDPNQIVEIREVIKNLGQNKTVLFSSHILQEVEAICDRVIIINRGKLVANDKLSNLRQQADNNNLLRVTFKEPLEAAWLTRLSSVQTVNKISTHEWELVCTNAKDAQRQVMELALQENLNIISLQAGGQSLEDVFRSLTNTNTNA
ncbi:gliding motility-associated ABC transporter ATP-binding subunit GldA [Niastella yeongjuensis]|uniref:Gliding motility-associated ABC transporter ATP-binding subunit GldA n=1 Tax=Niastella yeongjuensis TaxID=354355 RepID=A0A1V9EXV3_9BACT|nr:gliding motility-associated ABC transporter ATP-binding subunit GldA [Niastella yeongjuensis]OQP50734.1 gliding motility-associated ABC transporter ATP-binding subunit GldA [Niastella yeongjuensis]SEN20443.1 ABC-2 type transport system ATP-binding protein [Niastella yeongjuensis]